MEALGSLLPIQRTLVYSGGSEELHMPVISFTLVLITGLYLAATRTHEMYFISISLFLSVLIPTFLCPGWAGRVGQAGVRKTWAEPTIPGA